VEVVLDLHLKVQLQEDQVDQVVEVDLFLIQVELALLIKDLMED
jgi:hypothetical protein